MRFSAAGFLTAEGEEEADVCIINSCTVTSVADAKTRQKIRQARAQNPEALVCVIGCFPEVSRGEALGMPEVDIAIGSADKENTVEVVLREMRYRGSGGFVDTHLPLRGVVKKEKKGGLQPAVYLGRTRAYIKVQDGCDRFCAYCVIPFARGAVWSKAAGDVLAEAAGLIEAGYRDVVLTGINLALYRDGDVDLYELVKRVCGLGCGSGRQNDASWLAKRECAEAAPTDGGYRGKNVSVAINDEGGLRRPESGGVRVRLGSLEPTVIDAGYAARIAGIKGVFPELHLSLQSGSARTLEAMGRCYTPEDYAGIVSALRRVNPMFSVTTDVIVGFPGETEADFEESLEFVKSMGFARVHVFRYSKRPKTRAAELNGQVSEAEKKERCKRMINST